MISFSLDEAIALLKIVPGFKLSDSDVNALNIHTEGWATGLKMVGLSLRGTSDIGKFVASFTGSQRYIMDYLMEEVLENNPRRCINSCYGLLYWTN